MKKIILIISILLTCVFAFTGCVSNVNPTPMESIWGKSNVYEESTYKISFQPKKEGNPPATLSLDEANSSLSCVLESANDETFTLKTTLKMKGEYTMNGTKYPVDDIVETFAHFKSVANFELFPISSYRISKTTAPEYNASTKKYEIKTTDFKQSTTYKDKTATVETNAYNEKTDAYDKMLYPIEQKRTFKKLDGLFFDNNMLEFGIRAFVIDEKFTASFRTLDLTNLQTLSVNFNNEKNASKKVTKTFNVNGKEESVIVWDLMCNINNTMKGASLKLYYAVNSAEQKALKGRLYEFIRVLPYELGSLTYSLSNVSEVKI